MADAVPPPHYSEAFTPDGPDAGTRWGWQCLKPDCGAEELVGSLAEAEEAAGAHDAVQNTADRLRAAIVMTGKDPDEELVQQAARAHVHAMSQPVEEGEIRTWTDRINQPRQGRVTLVDGEHVELLTAGGGIARITRDMLHPRPAPPTEEELAAAKEADDARARAWLEQTLATRVEDAVTGAWDALRALDPDRDSDALKIDAAKAVVAASQGLLKRLQQHVADRKKSKPTEETQ